VETASASDKIVGNIMTVARRDELSLLYSEGVMAKEAGLEKGCVLSLSEWKGVFGRGPSTETEPALKRPRKGGGWGRLGLLADLYRERRGGVTLGG